MSDNLKDYYEENGLSVPKNLLPREEWLFDKLQEDIKFLSDGVTELSVRDTQHDKTVKALTDQLKQSKLKLSLLRFVDADRLPYTVTFIFTMLLGTFVLGFSLFDARNADNQAVRARLEKLERTDLFLQNKKLREDNEKLKHKKCFGIF
jgi:hypothetical protein